MNNIYLSLLKTIAPSIIAILRNEAKKTNNKIDDKLVTILESILKEFGLL